MIIFTLLFLLLTLRYLIKGTPFSDLLKEAKIAIVEESWDKKITIKIISVFVLMTTLLIAKLLYFAYAFDIDIYKYPTVIMIALILIRFFIFRRADSKEKEKPLLAIEPVKVNRYSAVGILNSLLGMAYYSYILYLLTR